jgi:hypothetical protein
MWNDEEANTDSLVPPLDRIADWLRIVTRVIWIGAAVVAGAALLVILLHSLAHAHDDGRYANDPLHPWFGTLHSQTGIPCCDTADGEKVEDVDWDTRRDAAGKVHYRVRLLGAWNNVPDEAVIKQPNLAGVAIVWPVYADDGNGHKSVAFIRCFIAGSGA